MNAYKYNANSEGYKWKPHLNNKCFSRWKSKDMIASIN